MNANDGGGFRMVAKTFDEAAEFYLRVAEDEARRGNWDVALMEIRRAFAALELRNGGEDSRAMRSPAWNPRRRRQA